MTGQQFYVFMTGWIQLVLPTASYIQAYQNLEPPATPYIAIEDDQDWQPFGRSDNTQVDTQTNLSFSYTASPVLWEVGGLGDYLRAMKESLETEVVKNYFAANNVGILHAGRVVSMPYLSTETEFTREKRLEFSFSVNNDGADPNLAVHTAGITGTWSAPT